MVSPVRRGRYPAGRPALRQGLSEPNVSVQWTPGDYDKKVAAALLTSSGPDIFEAGNGPASTRSKAARSLRWTACWAMPPVTSTPR